MGKAKKVITAVAIFAVLSAGLIYYGLSKSMVYYLTPTELAELGDEAYGTNLRLSGTVAEGSVSFNLETQTLSFIITDGQKSYRVIYNGFAPDTFREGVDAVVEGKLSSDGTFHANEIFTKCASKYEPKG